MPDATDINHDRRNPHRPFDPRLIEGWLDGRQIASASMLTTGKSNSTWRISTDDGCSYAVRLYCNSSPAHEAHVMSLAAAAGVPVPELLFGGSDVAVFAWVEGKHLADAPDLADQAAMVIARLAGIGFSAAGMIGDDGAIRPWPFAAEGFVEKMLRDDRVRHWLGQRRLTELGAIWADQADRLAQLATHSSLVHGDFNPTNILVHNGEIAAVLDWEFAHAGTPFMDIANLLRNLDPRWHPAIEAGLRASGFKLPPDWRQLALLIDLGSHLEFLSSSRSDSFKQTRLQLIDAFLAAFQ